MKTSVELMAEIMPSVRAAVAREMTARDMSQAEIAALLGVTQAAVSQYLRNIRGHGAGINDALLRAEARKLTERIVSGKAHRDDLEQEFYAVCRLVVQR